MIYTSYFGSGKYDISRSISIALYTPDFIKDKIEVYTPLCPSWGMIEHYKKTNDKLRYILRYTLDRLGRLDESRIADDLDGLTLLCYEKSGEFCHRHIVSKWLNDYTGIEVKEL
jgi:hypothetical protein